MPAPYQGLRNRVVAIVDARLGERLRFRPVAKGRPDPDRSESDVVGVLRTGEQSPGPMTGGARSGKARVLAEGASAVLALAVDAYGGMDIRIGDDFCALGRPGQPWFEVLHINRRHHARVYVHLGEGGG